MSGRTDTERLDWLEKNRLQVAYHQYGQSPEQRLNQWAVWNCAGSKCEKLSVSASARSAIDGAMNVEERR